MPYAVVIGAGIGGLATAVALRRRDWDVTVLERAGLHGRDELADRRPATAMSLAGRFGPDTVLRQMDPILSWRP